MNRKFLFQYKSIAWLLAIAVLVLALSPSHLHLHHSDETTPGSHGHVLDHHFVAEFSEQDHHEQAHVVKVAPDGLMKSFNDNPLQYLLFVFIVAFAPFVVTTGRELTFETTVCLRQSYHHIIPPLRAPPRQ